MKSLLYFLAGLFAVAIIIFAAGPRPDANDDITFNTSSIGSDLDAYLAQSESVIPNLVTGVEKEIIWRDPVTKAKTPIAVIYIHGFSATKMEIRPVPEKLAEALGANLFFTRLTGHGRDGIGPMTSLKRSKSANALAKKSSFFRPRPAARFQSGVRRGRT